MASRTIQTGDELEAALAYLAKKQGTSSEALFSDKVSSVLNKVMDEADSDRFNEAQNILSSSGTTADKVSKLRELLK